MFCPPMSYNNFVIRIDVVDMDSDGRWRCIGSAAHEYPPTKASFMPRGNQYPGVDEILVTASNTLKMWRVGKGLECVATFSNPRTAGENPSEHALPPQTSFDWSPVFSVHAVHTCYHYF